MIKKLNLTTALIMIILITLFLLASKVYFNTKEITTASESCYENGGNPSVESTFLTLGYSFTCSSDK
ncbi:hypothetical protein CEQ21_02425 [Niallia circulans]|uniref:Uncharacterized protein n=1 Tax=Niallia circulans TaxID=1397 RepID=A0A553SS81_NIACI|nr:hypothetical protein [Niallia circulans]TRZ39821.1 hypothetical protein CEQ21_02425 [Niallia circulans]